MSIVSKGLKAAARRGEKKAVRESAEEFAVREMPKKPKPIERVEKPARKPKAKVRTRETSTINVGLGRSNKFRGRPPTKQEVVAAVKSTGRRPGKVSVVRSDTEPTVVMDVSPPLRAEEAGPLSSLLRQEGIAQHLGDGKGGLYGPYAADWGDFNTQFYRTHSGERLSDVLSAKPQAPAIIKRVEGANKRARTTSSKSDLAARYPAAPDPVLKVDRKTGKEFWSKGKSPEADAAAQDLKVITADMEESGYTPFFDPEARYYADPVNYPLVGNTRDIRPARDDTLQRYVAKANDPEALNRARAAYARGAEHPGAKQWYATGQLEQAYVDALGPEAGREAYKRQFADAMAATTGGMDPNANLRLAHFMNYLARDGGEVPLASHQLPYPIGGGKYGVIPNVAQYDRIINQGSGLSALNPKRFNFSGNFLGHTDRATLDEQMVSGIWDPKMRMPPANTYGVYEGALASLADELGVPPAEAQDVMWAGIKLPKEAAYKPAPMISIVNAAIERTSRLTGLSPEEVVEGMVKANRPLYAKGGRVRRKDLTVKA